MLKICLNNEICIIVYLRSYSERLATATKLAAKRVIKSM